MHAFKTLKTALRYPWNDGRAGTTIVGGGILTLLSPLVLPGLIVAGYLLRVLDDVVDGSEEPPRFGEWEELLVDGVKAVVVLIVYVLIPLIIGGIVLSILAGVLGFRSGAGLPSLSQAIAVGGVAFFLVLLLAGLALFVWYVAPAALVLLAQTRRLKTAFDRELVRELAGSDPYASVWLLAVVVFAANAVVLLVLNAAGVGVILSGFISFYAFVSMAHLLGHGASELDMEIELEADTEGEGSEESDESTEE